MPEAIDPRLVFPSHETQITNHGYSGARKRTRTSTPLRELAPEASASANSAIRAYKQVLRGNLIVPARGGVCQRDASKSRRIPGLSGNRRQ